MLQLLPYLKVGGYLLLHGNLPIYSSPKYDANIFQGQIYLVTEYLKFKYSSQMDILVFASHPGLAIARKNCN